MSGSVFFASATLPEPTHAVGSPVASYSGESLEKAILTYVSITLLCVAVPCLLFVPVLARRKWPIGVDKSVDRVRDTQSSPIRRLVGQVDPMLVSYRLTVEKCPTFKHAKVDSSLSFRGEPREEQSSATGHGLCTQHIPAYMSFYINSSVGDSSRDGTYSDSSRLCHLKQSFSSIDYLSICVDIGLAHSPCVRCMDLLL